MQAGHNSMIDNWKVYAEKFDALTIRERGMIVVAIVVVLGYMWWMLFADSQLAETRRLQQQNAGLEQEIQTLQMTTSQISNRLQQGVHQSKQQQLELMYNELDRVNEILQQKTLELIEPNDMFSLMQQMIFSDSRLKLSGLKRKSVTPVFTANEQQQVENSNIYRHVMQIRFQGSYQDTFNYIANLEQLEWKLIWDRIELTLSEYPVIDVDIEISTLSESSYWVGL